MTKDDIIKLAQEAGFVEYELDDGTTDAFDVRYERFANLVAAAEREACAKMAEDMNEIGHSYGLENRIRARGTT